MDSIQLRPPEPADTPELGRICYEAFRGISTRHGFPPDLPDAEAGARVVDLIQRLPGRFGVAALVNDRLVGSNFMMVADPVAGLGPITVDPACQARGVGRRLMEAALAFAASRGIAQVRLMQDSYNTASLSLYASLGFEVREPVGLMQAGPGAEPHPAIRPAVPDDLTALDELTRRHYRTSRRHELAAWLELGHPVMVFEGGDRLEGYLMPGKLGHGVATNLAVASALISQISRYLVDGQNLFFCPLRQAALYREALQQGCRLMKVMNLMTFGPYEPPEPTWMPSIAY